MTELSRSAADQDLVALQFAPFVGDNTMLAPLNGLSRSAPRWRDMSTKCVDIDSEYLRATCCTW